MTDNGFDEWFNELVGFSFRSEWFDDDFDHAAKTNDYKKMSITKLKALVSEKGLSENISKLKKNELIQLLESNST